MPQRAAVGALVQTAIHVLTTTAILLAAYWLAPVQDPLGGSWVIRVLAGLLVVGLVLRWQIAAVRGSRRPMQRAAQGIMVSVGVFLIVFAIIYLALNRADPEAFSRPLDKVSALYFAITTLGTVGYGDITPVSHGAQIVASIQMMVDLVLLAVVARVLLRTASGEVSRRNETGGGSGT